MNADHPEADPKSDSAAEAVPAGPRAALAAPPGRPVVRLRPKRGGRFFAGAPWVYADELALDRRTKALPAGTIATLEDVERQPVATVALNTGSTIAARALDRDPTATIDGAWIEAKLLRALDLRRRLYEGEVYRLVHAEADGLPGLVIDRYGQALVVQPNAAWAETHRTAILAALARVLAPKIVVWNGQSRARALEGLPSELRVLEGVLDGPIAVEMNGALYLADLSGGQKTGLFLDQRDNQAMVAKLARGRSLLDVFAHVGGFSLAALAAGALRAVAIDGSQPALALAAEAAARMGVAERFETRRADAFDALREIAAAGERFDVVVCDPPAFAPAKTALEAGLRAYAKCARLGIAATAPGGDFVLCSCSHAVEMAALEAAVATALRRAGREGRLVRRAGAGPDHPEHPALPETGYLKCLVYRLD